MRSPLESNKPGSMGPVLFRRHSRERCSNSTAHPLHENPQANFHRCFRPRLTNRRSQRPGRPPRIVRQSCTTSMSRLKLPCQPSQAPTRSNVASNARVIYDICIPQGQENHTSKTHNGPMAARQRRSHSRPSRQRFRRYARRRNTHR
jgi:hypothetical protein